MQAVTTLLDAWNGWIRIADVLSILVSLFGIPMLAWSEWRRRRKLEVWVECLDGSQKGARIFIERIPAGVSTRAEIVGIVTMKAGKDRMGLSDFRVSDARRGRTIVVPLRAKDFAKWDPAAPADEGS